MSSPIDEFEESPSASTGAWVVSLSVGTSLFLHLSALGLLAALILPGAGGISPTALDGSLVNTVLGEEGGSFGDGIDLMDGTSLIAAMEPNDPPAVETPNAFLDAAMTPQELLPEAPMEQMTSLLTLNDSASSPLSEKVSGRTVAGGKVGARGQGAGRGNGKGSGQGTGEGDGVGKGKGKGGFFGLKVKGKSTVFVVDASRSMNLPHAGPSRTRFNRVKLELTRAISSMTENEKFFIIFFGDNAYPMPADRMMEAAAPARKRFLLWANSQQAVGHTFPQPALLLALQLEPDQVYFLTDGEFDYSVVPTVTAANTEGVPIHSIGFSDNRGENFLLEIARRNSGTYTFIPPDEVDDEPADSGKSAMSIIGPLGQ